MRRYQTVQKRKQKGGVVCQRCPRRKHRVNPELRVGIAAWLLTMANKYRDIATRDAGKRGVKDVPGLLEARRHAKWALNVITELVNRINDQFDSADFLDYVQFVEDQWGLAPGVQVDDKAEWDQPTLFDVE